MKLLSDAHQGILPRIAFRRENLLIILLSALIAGMGAILLIQKFLAIPSTYPEFLVGGTSWDASSKFQDILSFPAFVAVFLLAGWGMYRIFTHLSKAGGQEYERQLTHVLAWWMIPLACAFGGILSQQPTSLLFAIPVALSGLAAIIASAHLNLIHRAFTPKELGTGALVILFAALIPTELFIMLDRLRLFSVLPGVTGGMTMTGFAYVLCLAAFLGLVAYQPETLRARMPLLLSVTQAGMGLFYLLIIPDLYVRETGDPAISFREWLPLLAILLTVCTAYDVRKRYLKFQSEKKWQLDRLFSPWAIFAIILLLKTGQTAMPIIPADDFQYGESLLGWWSYREFGMIPYIDYIPPHGLFADDVAGFFSWMFFDGTAGTLEESKRLVMTLTLMAGFFSLNAHTRSLGLSFICILLFASDNMYWAALNFLVLIPFFCLILRFPRMADSRKWLLAWPVWSVILMLLAPAQGYAFILCTIPALIYHARSITTITVTRNRLIPAAVIVMALFATPLPRMLYSVIRHVVENGSVYQVAYGIGWSSGYTDMAARNSSLLSYIVLDFFRMSWVWVLLAASAIILLMFRKPGYRQYLAVVAIPACTFILMMTSYAMGRIDILHSSRPGSLSSFSIAFLLPFLLSPLLTRNHKAILAAFIAFFCAGMGNHHLSLDGIRDAMQKNEVSELRSAAAMGIHNIGLAKMEDVHVDRLARVNKVLKTYLNYREPYLDLTGNNAQYMYFDRPPAMSMTAPVNLVPVELQLREVERIGNSKPRVALLQAENPETDGGRLALRSHLLYRFVLANYQAELHDGYIFGFHRDARLSSSPIQFSLADRTDSLWLNGVHRTEPALMVRDSLTLQYLAIGDKLTLPNGNVVKVERISRESNVVWMTDKPVPSRIFEEGHGIRVSLDSTRRMQLSTRLMQRAFSDPDLARIPASWGRSALSLGKKMTPVHDLDLEHGELKGMVRRGDSLVLKERSAAILLDLSADTISGASAGILSLNFNSSEKRECRMRISWWGDGMKGPDPDMGLWMTADNDRLIIPLDSHPGWLSMKKVEGIRLELFPPDDRSIFQIQNGLLSQRMTVSALTKK
jgi:hypothetical protein